MGITGQDIVMETRLESPEMHVKELMVRARVGADTCACLPLRGLSEPAPPHPSTAFTHDQPPSIHQELGFGKCSLSLQAPVKNGIAEAKQLSGGRIVTSFPNLTRAFFDKLDAESGKQTSACVRARGMHACAHRRTRQAADSNLSLSPHHRGAHGVGLGGGGLRAGAGGRGGGPGGDGHHHEGTHAGRMPACSVPLAARSSTD